MRRSNGECWEQLLADVAAAWPPERWSDVGVVVGCSGGADSVALMTALCDLRQRCESGEFGAARPRGFLVLAHFNHGLRGPQADADQEFVSKLAANRGIPAACARAERCDGADPASDEATMRRQRMDFLVDTAHAHGCRYVALAHSADDNVETVLHNLMRGTGPAGLCGIGSPRDLDEDLVLVRPLLGVRRSFIRDALKQSGQRWREDKSNEDIRYRRNWIRHHLIPSIQSQYPNAVQAIGRAIQGQRQWREVIDQLGRHWADRAIAETNGFTLQRDPHTDTAILVAATQQLWAERGWPRGEMNREHWIRLAETIASDRLERYSLPAGVDVHATAGSVRVGRSEASEADKRPEPGIGSRGPGGK